MQDASELQLRFGESWKYNPAYLEPLRALAAGLSRGFSPREIIDSVAILVDGVDLTGGLVETSLIDGAGELVRASHLLTRRASPGILRVRLGVDLNIDSDGSEVALSLALEGRVRRAVVARREFVQAVRTAAAGIVADLRLIHPALAEHRACRTVLAPWAGLRVGAEPEWLVRAAVGTSALALGESDQALVFLDPAGAACWKAPEALASLRLLAEITRARTRLTEKWPDASLPSVTVDWPLKSIRFGHGPPVAFAAVTRAIRELCKVMAEANRAVAQHLRAILHGLDDERVPVRSPAASDIPLSLPHRRSAPSNHVPGLRRLLFRRAWRATVMRGAELFGLGCLLVARTEAKVQVLSEAGTAVWEAPVLDAHTWQSGDTARLIGRDEAGQLVVFNAADGACLGLIPAALHHRLRAAESLFDGSIAVSDGARVVTLDPCGAGAWSYEPPTALSALAGGSALIVAASDGSVTRLDGGGRLAWRSPISLRDPAALLVDWEKGRIFVTGRAPDGLAALAALSLRDGRSLWTTTLGVRVAPILLRDGRMAVGWEGRDGPRLGLLDGQSGRLIWEAAPPGDGAVRPFLARRRLGVLRQGGGLALFTSRGRLACQVGPQDPDPSLSPSQRMAVIVEGSRIFATAAWIHVFDLHTGRPVAAIEPPELSPANVVVMGSSTVVAGDREGFVQAWLLNGHLRVIDGPDSNSGRG
jgi:hypothetical protein